MCCSVFMVCFYVQFLEHSTKQISLYGIMKSFWFWTWICPHAYKGASFKVLCVSSVVESCSWCYWTLVRWMFASCAVIPVHKIVCLRETSADWLRLTHIPGTVPLPGLLRTPRSPQHTHTHTHTLTLTKTHRHSDTFTNTHTITNTHTHTHSEKHSVIWTMLKNKLCVVDHIYTTLSWCPIPTCHLYPIFLIRCLQPLLKVTQNW